MQSGRQERKKKLVGSYYTLQRFSKCPQMRVMVEKRGIRKLGMVNDIQRDE